MDGTHRNIGVASNRATLWNATELLQHLTASDIVGSSDELEELRPELWRSICSEHDSRHFYKRLITSEIALPWELQDFLARWLWDEVNHARGFKMLYHSIYGVPFDQIETELCNREIDFRHLDEFFHDLTSVSLLFAFDELVTTRTYRSSIPFYESLGFVQAGEWARRLVFDESQHFASIMAILLKYCRDLDRAEPILTRIVDVDLQQQSYSGTFVLDHVCPEFPFDRAELLTMCDQAILRRLNRKPGSSQEWTQS